MTPRPDSSFRPSRSDLVARALDALPPAAKARVDAALETDPQLRQDFEAISGHLHEYDRLPEAPPPPPFARLAAALDAEGDAPAPDLGVLRLQSAGAPRPRRRWLPAVAAAAAVLLALLVWRPWTAGEAGGLDLVPGRGIELVRAGEPLPAPALARIAVRPGDRLHAREPAEARLGERVRLVLDTAARVRIEGGAAVTLEAGRAWFEVQPASGDQPAAFEVRTAHGPVRVLGTAFEVDVRGGALRVAVAHGRVAAGGHEITAGARLADGALAPADEPAGSWFQRPRLRVEEAVAAPGEPLRLTLVLENPLQVPIPLHPPSDVRVPVWLHFQDAEGRTVREIPVLPAHVTSDEGLLAQGRQRDLAPGRALRLTIEIPAPFTSPGTYLCRALYRPAGRPGVLSDARRLEVR